MAIKSTIKKKKKVWIPMYAPKFLNESFLGESLVSDKQAMIGKSLTLNLSIFTRDMKKQSTDVSFSVKSIVDNKGITEVTGLSLTNGYVKRLVRRGKSKVEDSFTVKSKDGHTLRIKPIVVTNNVVNQSVGSKIRAVTKEKLIGLVESNNADEFFELLLQQKSQKELKDVLSKLYPLRYVDVRVAHLVKRLSPKVKAEEKKEEATVEQ